MTTKTPLIIHDMFQIKGGGERLVQTLCEGLSADLLTAHIGVETFDLSHLAGAVENLDALSRLHGIKTWSLARAFKNHRPSGSPHPQVIYSGVASPLAIGQHPQAKNLFYCHTPPRFVYDKKDHYQNQLGWLKRQAFKQLINWFQPQYEQAIAQMDVLLTNSNYVNQRMQAALGMTAEVVYPPCDTKQFKWHTEGDFFLSVARHDPLKRVDQVIQAFRHMPDKQLVVASGGSETARLQQAAADCDNIRFTGWLSEAELLRLIGSCLATIYIPLDEDFGMSPVESMSAGKPVIGADHGGLLETLVAGETGLLVSNDHLQQDLIATVNHLTPNRALAMRQACEHRAQAFDTPVFIKKIKEFL